MLQRAASSAYSWWWASHVRTKQSKWLDSNLQEMEERVRCMLKLLGEEADSFSKRAEMYYKRRPEVISSVEEAYRAYRALAERYDHISGELHKANHTIATAFPDQVHYAMLEEDDNFPKAITPVDSSKIRKQTVEGLMKNKRDTKLHVFKEKKGINKDNAQEEINRLQKEILVIQTEKEFIKSSYESGIAKYWDLEKKMADLQEEICFLQEAFNASAVIEDKEARALMTATALKSCEDVIFNLQEQQKESLNLEKVEIARIKALRERLRAIKSDYGRTVTVTGEQVDLYTDEGESKVYEIKKERLELESIREKIKGLFEMDSEMSVGEVAEKIDQLVNKVADLELLVSSQTAQLNRLNLENGELEKFLENLEMEKETLVNDTEQLNRKLSQADEELGRAQSIQKAFRKDENVVRLNFSQAVNSLGNISEKLASPLSDVDYALGKSEPDNLYCRSSANEDGSANSIGGSIEPEDGAPSSSTGNEEFVQTKCKDDSGGNVLSLSSPDENHKSSSSKVEDFTGDKFVSEYPSKIETGHHENGTRSPATNGKLLLSRDEGVSDGGQEKEDLLNEYNTVLVGYKEMKKRLAEIETKNQERVHKLSAQITALLNVNATKDEEILSLKRLLETSTFSGNNIPPEQEKSIVSTPERVIFVNEPERNHQRNLSTLRDLNAEHTKEPDTTNGTHCAVSVSPLEEKFRTDIDALLEENLEFWMRFSTSIQRIQEFQTKYQQQLRKDEKALESDSTSTGTTKDLRDLKTELQVWLEQNVYLRSELQSRLTSIGNVHDEISQAVGPSFTLYQAAKFQGEVLNMQQENNRVADELRAALDQVRALQTEMEATLEWKEEAINISESSNRTQNSHDLRSMATKNRVPLQSFLFPAKTKKPSFFSYVNPVLQKQYSGIKHHFYTRLD